MTLVQFDAITFLYTNASILYTCAKCPDNEKGKNFLILWK